MASSLAVAAHEQARGSAVVEMDPHGLADEVGEELGRDARTVVAAKRRTN